MSYPDVVRARPKSMKTVVLLLVFWSGLHLLVGETVAALAAGGRQTPVAGPAVGDLVAGSVQPGATAPFGGSRPVPGNGFSINSRPGFNSGFGIHSGPVRTGQFAPRSRFGPVVPRPGFSGRPTATPPLTPPSLGRPPSPPALIPPDLGGTPTTPPLTPPRLGTPPTVPPLIPPDLGQPPSAPPLTPPDLGQPPSAPPLTPPDLGQPPTLPPLTPPSLGQTPTVQPLIPFSGPSRFR